MACVVAVQGLVFQDGGLVVMGANIFNMAIVGTLGGYASTRPAPGLRRRGPRPDPGRRRRRVAVGRGRPSRCMAIELGSPGRRLSSRCPPCSAVHVLIGIGEALITMAALGFIQVTRADLFTLRDARVAELAAAAPRRHTMQRAWRTRDRCPTPRRWWAVGLGHRRRHRASCSRPSPPRTRTAWSRWRATRDSSGRRRDAVYSIIPDYTIPGSTGRPSRRSGRPHRGRHRVPAWSCLGWLGSAGAVRRPSAANPGPRPLHRSREPAPPARRPPEVPAHDRVHRGDRPAADGVVRRARIAGRRSSLLSAARGWARSGPRGGRSSRFRSCSPPCR